MNMVSYKLPVLRYINTGNVMYNKKSIVNMIWYT